MFSFYLAVFRRARSCTEYRSTTLDPYKLYQQQSNRLLCSHDFLCSATMSLIFVVQSE